MFPHWFPQFVLPSAAWLLALLVPIVVFYFLKLRRSQIEVSSLALWRQVVSDQRVNAPFQRFKRNLLLLLQLLLLCLVALAAMQPFLPGSERGVHYLPILIDCSASMGAVDEAGKSRLDLAKQEISEIIDRLLPKQRLTLISVGATARRLTEFTDNKPVLRDALQQMQVQDVPSRIEEGLRLAQALARTQEIERARLYSDGNLPTRPNPSTGKPMAAADVDLPFTLDFFQIPPAGPNLGITALSARRAGLDRWEVFLRVDCSPAGGGEAQAALLANGAPAGEEQITLGPGESQRLGFSVSAKTSNHLQAVLTPRSRDALASDNRAWLDLPPGREIRVECAASLPTVRHALESIPEVSVSSRVEGNLDLLISDQAADEARAAPLSVLLGVVPKELRELVDILNQPTEVIDWQRDAPLLQHVQLRDVLLSEMPAKRSGVEDKQIEQLGYEVLASGTRGPVVLRKRDAAQVRYYFLFHLDRSTLPYRVGFPVLVANIVAECVQQASLGDMSAAPTGVLPPLKLTPNGTYQVTDPAGKHEERQANAEGILDGVAAPQIGEYEVRGSGRPLDKIGVSLLSPLETSLVGVEKIYFNEVSVSAQQERQQTDRPLWTQLAWLALAVLLLEWWYFNKRPGGVPE